MIGGEAAARMIRGEAVARMIGGEERERRRRRRDGDQPEHCCGGKQKAVSRSRAFQLSTEISDKITTDAPQNF